MLDLAGPAEDERHASYEVRVAAIVEAQATGKVNDRIPAVDLFAMVLRISESRLSGPPGLPAVASAAATVSTAIGSMTGRGASSGPRGCVRGQATHAARTWPTTLLGDEYGHSPIRDDAAGLPDSRPPGASPQQPPPWPAGPRRGRGATSSAALSDVVQVDGD
ncbi:hypothetical protein [Streptomyces sp. NPDC059861]|uniref:hypothetical protein n=1 Tax=Streptomyces sp. NPDC059861 TaxID=3346974 RepID=UPI00364B3840